MLSSLRGKALHFLDQTNLGRVQQTVASLQGVSQGRWAQLELSTMLRDWNDQAAQLAAVPHSPQTPAPQTDRQVNDLAQQLERILRGLDHALQGPPHQVPHLTASLLSAPDHPLAHLPVDKDGYILFDQGQTGLVLVRLKKTTEGQFAQGAEAITSLREIIQDQQTQCRDVAIGLTGLPILEYDEMSISQSDMVLASVLSLLGVACLFVAGFGGIRLPLLTVCSLLLAIGWSFGYITLGIGHLNILSISFGVILIGLGIDFGIHYVARYTQLRAAGQECTKALIETSAGVGPGIITGGVTTAVAFAAAALTQFTGVVELGLIAGGGILLCIVASLTVLPVMIRSLDRDQSHWQPPRPLPFAALCTPVLWFPRTALLLTVVATAWLGCGIPRLAFDHNLLNLQAAGLESVEWEHRLLESGDHGVWFAVSMTSTPQELAARKERFAKLTCVQRVEEISSLSPAADPQKSEIIRHIHRTLGNLPAEVPLLPVAPPQVLQQELRRTESIVRNQPQTPRALQPLISQVTSHLERLDPTDCSRRISQFQQQLARELLDQLRQLHDVANPEAPTTGDLPPALRDRFVGQHGRHLLRVYPRGNVWDMEALTQFVTSLESVDPQVTGHPVQAYYSSRQMQQSYVHAAIYSVLAVIIILMLDLRSVRLVLLAIVPMAVGMLQLFGLLGWLGIPLNPANLIVLPLILGIGIDDGVHIVHDFLHARQTYRMSPSTASAVVLTSATTMVGFGSMMIANHQGLRSLGQVLSLGVFLCLLTSLVTLPAALAIIARRRPSVANGAESSGAESSGTPPTGTTANEGEPATSGTADLHRPRRHRPLLESGTRDRRKEPE